MCQAARLTLRTDTPSRLFRDSTTVINSLSNPEYKLAANLMKSAGYRINEVCNLKKDSLQKTEQGYQLCLSNTKGGRPRQIDIPKSFGESLETVIARNGEFRLNPHSLAKSEPPPEDR